MLSEVPTKLPLTLKAYVLSKDNLNTLEQWHPAHHVVNEGVTGGEVHQTVLCNEGQGEPTVGGGIAGLDGEPAGLLGGVADFVFKGESCVSAFRTQPIGNWVSRKAPVTRWKLFTLFPMLHAAFHKCIPASSTPLVSFCTPLALVFRPPALQSSVTQPATPELPFGLFESMASQVLGLPGGRCCRPACWPFTAVLALSAAVLQI